MATCRLSVEIKCKWWLPVYTRTLTLLCMMMRCEPDYQKVAEFIVKHGISQRMKSELVKR